MPLSPLDRRCRTAALVVGLVLAAVMVATFRDYGVTGDEGFQHRYGRRLERWYLTLGADRSAVEQHDTYYYGGFFDLLAEGATRVLPFGVYESRHLAGVVISLVGFLGVYLMGNHLSGACGGLAALLLLILTPPFYGHAFSNPKDLPFAALYALALAFALRTGRTGAPVLRDVVLTGVAAGLTAGVRVAGLSLLPFIALLWAGRWGFARWRGAKVDAECGEPAGRVETDRFDGDDAAKPAPWNLRALVLAVVLAGAVAYGLMVVFWPWAQLDPLRNPFRAFEVFSHFWENMQILYDGRLVSSGEVSRFYALRYLSLTLPETYAVAAAVGGLGLVLGALRPAGRASRLAAFELLWLAIVGAFPLAWLVVRNVPLYNGVRHVLFVVPILAVLAGVSLTEGLRRLPRALGHVALALVLLLGFVTLVDMVRLHPYQALYFNRSVAGGLAGAVGRWETDYWCSSYKEGVQWIVARHESRPADGKVRIAGHSGVFQITADLRTPELEARFQGVTIHDNPHYILATTATGDHQRTPGRPIHVIQRMGAPIAYVFAVRPVGKASP